MAVHAVLFLMTLATTLIAGALLGGANPFRDPAALLSGTRFALPLLAVLGIHELGHYAAARRHHVGVTPPYFLPVPPVSPFVDTLYIGTFGAFIRIRTPVPSRNALLDIGAAGPLAGVAVAVPVLVLGLTMSQLRLIAPTAGLHVKLGESLILKAATWLVFGRIPAGYDVVLHPVAFAGWFGLFVTMLNLIPSGQLDGGHIAYALFGNRYAEPARLVPYALLLMGLVWPGWFVWALLLFVLGTRHPRPIDPTVPLSRARRRVGYLAAAVFVLCFTPNPISL